MTLEAAGRRQAGWGKGGRSRRASPLPRPSGGGTFPPDKLGGLFQTAGRWLGGGTFPPDKLGGLFQAAGRWLGGGALPFSAMRDSTAKHLSTLHTGLYRLTGGVIGRRLVDNDMLLLTTSGRITGRDHTVPLLYLEADDGWVVIASWGGRPDNPEWYKNLEAQPKATVKIRSRAHPVTARTADRNERAVWWPRVVNAYEGYATYQSRSSREIPLVFLHRIPD